MIMLNYRDASPIYEQVKKGFKNMILTGSLTEDSKLPSVRELAMQLAINPNTIQRAYRELENEGYIYSIAGKGSFVSAGGDVKRKRVSECFDVLDSTVNELVKLGVDKNEIIKHMENGGKDSDSGN